jgi:hypothetical protein
MVNFKIDWAWMEEKEKIREMHNQTSDFIESSFKLIGY